MSHEVKLSSKGQVTIPIEVRRALKVVPHDRVAFVLEHGQVRLEPAQQSVVSRTAGMLSSYAQDVKTPSCDDIEQLIASETVERSR